LDVIEGNVDGGVGFQFCMESSSWYSETDWTRAFLISWHLCRYRRR